VAGPEDVEFATLEWVAWFNTQRLREPLGYLPPAEFEAPYYHTQAAGLTLPVAVAPNELSLR
jgi:transposase InsO family protein